MSILIIFLSFIFLEYFQILPKQNLFNTGFKFLANNVLIIANEGDRFTGLLLWTSILFLSLILLSFIGILIGISPLYIKVIFNVLFMYSFINVSSTVTEISSICSLLDSKEDLREFLISKGYKKNLLFSENNIILTAIRYMSIISYRNVISNFIAYGIFGVTGMIITNLLLSTSIIWSNTTLESYINKFILFADWIPLRVTVCIMALVGDFVSTKLAYERYNGLIASYNISNPNNNIQLLIYSCMAAVSIPEERIYYDQMGSSNSSALSIAKYQAYRLMPNDILIIKNLLFRTVSMTMLISFSLCLMGL